ncbi:TPR end-of-group domain-containing protein [Lutibacter flavus]|uniref:TPR repeat-containing protein n=1 Tax=Lutibacter flavus TaxID=691689 RepID=A0A238Y916_9FLAO|nr:hypothetical protein [Lutibacter flavus]SNR67074.1 TPR repeat-containing protein [Lutibacter flavus]
MTELLVLAWLILSILVGSMGSSKSIGGTGAFFISLFFSPLIGLLFVISSSPKVKVKKINPKIIELTKSAVKADDEGNYEEAVSYLKEALSYNAKSLGTHFNLSLLYSKLNNKEKAFTHLEKAIEFGYRNFNKIATSNDLEWLREQPDYNEFITNGYKFDKTKGIKSNYIEELKELGNLKERGLITETEFEIQKGKILN